MRIAVIAANGRLGQCFVAEALKAGHVVTAGVRGNHDLKPHPSLKIMRCDATQANEVRTLLNGQDAVVSAIGHIKDSPADVQTNATKTIVSVMKELGMTRFVDVTGTGVRFQGDKITLIDRLLNLAVGIIDPKRVKDGRTHQTVLRTSDLDWTTIRVLKLQHVRPRPYLLTPHGPTKSYVGRREVAQAMLEVIEQRSFVKEAPIISKPIR